MLDAVVIKVLISHIQWKQVSFSRPCSVIKKSITWVCGGLLLIRSTVIRSTDVL